MYVQTITTSVCDIEADDRPNINEVFILKTLEKPQGLSRQDQKP